MYDPSTLNYMVMDDSMDDGKPLSVPISNGDIKAVETKIREPPGVE